MAKNISKNAKTNRQATVGSKDYVKVIKAVKTKGNYGFLEKIVHKDKVQEFLAAKSWFFSQNFEWSFFYIVREALFV